MMGDLAVMPGHWSEGASLYKIMVESGVGVFGRTDGHNRKVQVINGMGGDRGGNRRLLPFLVRLTNQESSPNKSKNDHCKPQDLD